MTIIQSSNALGIGIELDARQHSVANYLDTSRYTSRTTECAPHTLLAEAIKTPLENGEAVCPTNTVPLDQLARLRRRLQLEDSHWHYCGQLFPNSQPRRPKFTLKWETYYNRREALFFEFTQDYRRWKKRMPRGYDYSQPLATLEAINAMLADTGDKAWIAFGGTRHGNSQTRHRYRRVLGGSAAILTFVNFQATVVVWPTGTDNEVLELDYTTDRNYRLGYMWKGYING
jgi:hypothetical protein